jgi:hypothetical protein
MQSALVAEEEACRMGLKLLSNEADIKVVVETDSKALVDLWKIRDHDRSEIAMILADIQELTRNFSSFSCKEGC